MRRDPLHQEEIEARWEAAPAVAVLLVLQPALAVVSRIEEWELWIFPWWVWLMPVVPEVLLLLFLAWERPGHRLELLGIRREAALALLGAVSLANSLLLLGLVGSLLRADQGGAQLLAEAGAVWCTNVIAFGLGFWAFDRGGPIRRIRPDPPPPDFQFPQLENPELAGPDWSPHFVDYLYVSYTNSVAWSPTDAMPLTRAAKLLMLAESAISALTVLLVAARAINILR